VYSVEHKREDSQGEDGDEEGEQDGRQQVVESKFSVTPSFFTNCETFHRILSIFRITFIRKKSVKKRSIFESPL